MVIVFRCKMPIASGILGEVHGKSQDNPVEAGKEAGKELRKQGRSN